MRFARGMSVAVILALCFTVSACGGKRSSLGGPINGVICRDVVTLPQNLDGYAAAAGGNRALASGPAQAAAAMNQKDRLYRPWQRTEPARWIRQSLDKNFSMKPDNAYVAPGRPFPMDAWQQLVDNSNKGAYPSGVDKGITLRHTNLRAMPTSMPFYLDPSKPGEGHPFDYFQHTSLPMGTPLFICNVSRDGLWLLVETPVTAGWLPAGDVARVDEAFVDRWQSRPLAALVRDRVSVGASAEHIGTLLPLADAASYGRGHALRVYYPKRAAGAGAEIATTVLGPGDAVAVPLPLSPNEVAKVGNEMMGQAYGWGGLGGLRDCSALTRDIFAPFGIWLPRNSGRQTKVGTPIPLAGISNDEKEVRIATQATPFASLIWLPGHITLYIGQHKGKPVMFHNMWGLRTRDSAGTCDGRAIVGKAVVTTLRPGVERPDLCFPSILDRIQRVTILPGYDYSNAEQ